MTTALVACRLSLYLTHPRVRYSDFWLIFVRILPASYMILIPVSLFVLLVVQHYLTLTHS